MGRLHYQARKIEGIKAGQVVSKDLHKRIIPGTSSKAAARDPTLELDVSGKKLTDEGLSQFTDDLIECIKFRDRDHPDGAAKLMEFLLQGNEITARSLPKLAEVVSLSAGDLREFDISKNNILVHTPEDKAMWQAFLGSFRDCYMLKKLDLGGNPLETAGMEILARVYIQSDLDFLECDAEDVLGSMHEEEFSLAEEMETLNLKPGKENEPIRGRPKKSANKSKGRSSETQFCKAVTQADLKRYACTRGLRSIPYLILSNTFTTNAGAIHLSSMLNVQRSPEQLLAFLPPGKAVSLPYTTMSQSKGIVWLPNELDLLARKMIDMGEAVRQLSMDSNSEDDSYANPSSGNGQMYEQSQGSSSDTASQRKLQKKLDVEYTRLVKRVRMETLKNNSAHEVEIWSTALKMMLVSRALLLEDCDRIVEFGADSDHDGAILQEPESQNGFHGQGHGLEHNQFVHDNIYAGSAWPSVKIPAIHVTEVDEFKSSPWQIPTLIKLSGYNEDEASHHVPAAQTASHQAKVVTRAHSGTGSTQKLNWRYGLPLRLWRCIIADAVGANGILTRHQQEQIIRYAADWDVLAYKLTIKGVEDYQQIWKFLETVDCFTYSSLS